MTLDVAASLYIAAAVYFTAGVSAIMHGGHTMRLTPRGLQVAYILWVCFGWLLQFLVGAVLEVLTAHTFGAPVALVLALTAAGAASAGYTFAGLSAMLTGPKSTHSVSPQSTSPATTKFAP